MNMEGVEARTTKSPALGEALSLMIYVRRKQPLIIHLFFQRLCMLEMLGYLAMGLL